MKRIDRNRRTSAPSSGFTLIEVVLAAALMISFLLAIGFAMQRMSSAYRAGSVENQVEQNAHRLLEFVVGQIADAGVAGLDPQPTTDFGSSTLTFRHAAGYAAGAVVWGPEFQILWELEQGELNDGLDNNGNGLADEGNVVFVRNPGLPSEVRVTKGHWVREFLEGEVPNLADDNDNLLTDERGLSFHLQESVMTVRVSLERLHPEGRSITRTVETSVRLRN